MRSKLQQLIENDKQESIGFQPIIRLKNECIEESVVLNKKITVYIHIPFCERRCTFCGILSTTKFDEKIIDDYIKAVINEIKRYSNTFLSGRQIEAIHFGGGTPSVLSAEGIENIIATIKENCDCSKLEEIVIESNPMSLSKEKIDKISQFGNIKLNVGIQTFNEKQLKIINRDYDINKVKEILSYAVNSKLDGVGIDVICGLPYSSEETIISDMEVAKNLEIHYISLYPLWIENNAVLKKTIKDKDVIIPDYYQRKMMLIKAEEYLSENDFERFSSYHFVRKGLKNYIYNQRQMENEEWIGIGVGAASYISGYLLNNTSNINEYNTNDFTTRNAIHKIKELNVSEKILRDLAFNLRIMPLNKEKLIQKYGGFVFENLYKKVEMLKENGLIDESERELILTHDGILNLSYIEKIVLNNL